MVHGKIDTEGLTFEPALADVEALNQKAFAAEFPITKLSYHAFCHLTDRYQLLNSGSALGRGVGPLLIASKPLSRQNLLSGPVAIPGKYTTANFLLSAAYPGLINKREMLFSEIEEAVLSGDAIAGLLIHENRFTYAERGLHKLMDLGDFWEGETGRPIPLGGIVVSRELPLPTRRMIDRVLRRSIEFAFTHPEESLAYVTDHAQAMDSVVMKKHIDLYVNEFTLDLGEEGRESVLFMLELAKEKGIISGYASDFGIWHPGEISDSE